MLCDIWETENEIKERYGFGIIFPRKKVKIVKAKTTKEILRNYKKKIILDVEYLGERSIMQKISEGNCFVLLNLNPLFVSHCWREIRKIEHFTKLLYKKGVKVVTASFLSEENPRTARDIINVLHYFGIPPRKSKEWMSNILNLLYPYL